MVHRPWHLCALRGLSGRKLQQRCSLRHVHGRHTQQRCRRQGQYHLRSMRSWHLQPLSGRFKRMLCVRCRHLFVVYRLLFNMQNMHHGQLHLCSERDSVRPMLRGHILRNSGRDHGRQVQKMCSRLLFDRSWGHRRRQVQIVLRWLLLVRAGCHQRQHMWPVRAGHLFVGSGRFDGLRRVRPGTLRCGGGWRFL